MKSVAATLEFCPHCGAKIEDQMDTCPHCQTDLRPFRASEKPDESTKQTLNLSALYANPYREGMKHLAKRRPQATAKWHWHWPWSKE